MKKVAVVTGAGGVLCTAFSKALAENGYAVAMLNRSVETMQKTAEEINAAGGTAKCYQVNVLDKEGLIEVKKRVNAELGKCSVLLNGAGGNSPECTTAHEEFEKGDEAREDIKTFFNLEKSGFSNVFDLNIMGTLLPTQVFAADMIGEQDCCIINVSSMNSYRPLTKIPAYSSAKAAVSNFTMWLATHFAKEGIRVNAIAPGFFVSKQNKSLLFHEDGTPTPRTEKILRATPMGRFGQPEELIGTLLYLVDSKASGFVTGIVIPVDGGFSAYSGV